MITIIIITSLISFSKFSVLRAKCQSTLQLCDFWVPKSPIHYAFKLSYSGISQSQCSLRMERFDWPVGLYCAPSGFCGLGLDQFRDWSSFVSSAVQPVGEMCRVIVDVVKNSCYQFMDILFHTGILRSELHFTKPRTSQDFFCELVLSHVRELRISSL